MGASVWLIWVLGLVITGSPGTYSEFGDAKSVHQTLDGVKR